MTTTNQMNPNNITDITENRTRQLKNIRALLSKFKEVTLLGGLPTRYESAFYHQKRENRTHYHIDTYDTSTIVDFITEVPNKNRNYHISLGPVSFHNDPDPDTPKTLFIIDLDVNHDGSTSNGIATFKNSLSKYFPHRTFSVRTKSGGLHLYFYTTVQFVREYDLKKIVSWMDGIDILSSNLDPDKMYSIIGPGSYSTFDGHQKSKKTRYAIEENIAIQPLPPQFIDFLKENRNAYTSWHKEEVAKLYQNASAKIPLDDKTNIRAAKSYINDLIIEANAHYKQNHTCLYEGKRNDSLNRFAYHLATYALSTETFTQLAEQINDNVFRSPLNHEEFQTTIKSALNARTQAGETSLNAETDLPDVTPFRQENISYTEILPRARLVKRILNEKLQSSQKGIKILTSVLFQTDSSTFLVKAPPLEDVLSTFQKRIEDSDYITYAELLSLARTAEMEFVLLKSKENIANYLGKVEIPAISDKGYPKKGIITNHPYYEAVSKHGVTPTFDSPNENILNNGRLHLVSPPPLSLLPTISEEEYRKQLPLIHEILEHFKITVTDPNYPEEFEYLLNFIAAMCQRKQVQAFIVLHGPQGTGKSQFLKFLSLFVPQEDCTNARNPNAVFEKFANVGTLTTIDDCNLNETKDLDALKSRVSEDVHMLERKFMQAMPIKKLVSIVAATNHLLTDIDFLHERRLIWFSSSAKYSGPEYLNIVNKQTRRLLANGGLGLAALHKFFQEYKITIRDWNFKSRAHLSLIRKVQNENNSGLESTSKWNIAKALSIKDREIRDREHIAVANAIANFGYVQGTDIHIPLCTHFEELKNYSDYNEFPVTTPDWLFFMRYYYDLKDGKVYDVNEYSHRIASSSQKVKSLLTNFTKDILNKERPLSNVVEEIYSPINKKVIPRVTMKDKIHSQKRVMVFTPLISWTSRFSILANGSVSKTLSYEMLKQYGLMPIVDFLSDRIEEPTKEECEELFKKLFPGQKFGAFNVVQKLIDVDIYDDEEDDSFTSEDTDE